MTKIRVTPHTPKTLLACLSGQLVREWHLTFERAAARHVEICSQLHGEVFISIVHYNGDINVPDHMPPSGFRVGAPRATILCPVRCSNTPPSAPVVRAAKCEVSVAYSKPLWMVWPLPSNNWYSPTSLLVLIWVSQLTFNGSLFEYITLSTIWFDEEISIMMDGDHSKHKATWGLLVCSKEPFIEHSLVLLWQVFLELAKPVRREISSSHCRPQGSL